MGAFGQDTLTAIRGLGRIVITMCPTPNAIAVAVVEPTIVGALVTV